MLIFQNLPSGFHFPFSIVLKTFSTKASISFVIHIFLLLFLCYFKSQWRNKALLLVFFLGWERLWKQWLDYIYVNLIYNFVSTHCCLSNDFTFHTTLADEELSRAVQVLQQLLTNLDKYLIWYSNFQHIFLKKSCLHNLCTILVQILNLRLLSGHVALNMISF
jgi:hypothetical protein